MPSPNPEESVYRKRRYARVPIVTPVEIHAREHVGAPIIGRIETLGAGGVLAACREPLPPETELAMAFSLPDGDRIHAFGRVIYATSGSRYGIEFTDLHGDALQQVQQFALKILGYKRRSTRVPFRMPLVIRSAKELGDLEIAETVLASRGGGLLVCRGTYAEGQEIYLWSPQRGGGARARVVFQQVWATDTLVELGFEFVGSASLWDIGFADEGQ